MPYSATDHAANIQLLGLEVKRYRTGAEQFCAFAFDLHEHKVLRPPTIGRAKEKCMRIGGKDFGEEPTNWMAAFFSMCGPMHTERAILEKFHSWLNRYSNVYGDPSILYIYSFLIPCQRDGSNGCCADAIASTLQQLRKYSGKLDVKIGWGNDDTDLEIAHATKNAFADLEDDGIDVEQYKISIAKRHKKA